MLVFKKSTTKDSITRTIRFSGETYDRICKTAEMNGISFNSVVNQIVEYFFKQECEE